VVGPKIARRTARLAAVTAPRFFVRAQGQPKCVRTREMLRRSRILTTHGGGIGAFWRLVQANSGTGSTRGTDGSNPSPSRTAANTILMITASEGCHFRKCGGPPRASAIHLERASNPAPSLNFTSGGATQVDRRLCVNHPGGVTCAVPRLP